MCCRAAKWHANTSRYQTATKPVQPIQLGAQLGPCPFCTMVRHDKHLDVDVDVDEDVDDDDEDVDDVAMTLQ